MLESAILTVIFFLLVMLVIYIWASQRNIIKNRPLTPQEYLWKLKQISEKSEYEIFHIAAEEKGWPDYQVERHFARYLENQTLPEYVKKFLEDGTAYIDAYRPRRGKFLNKRVLVFYTLFTLLMVGGSFFFCLYIYPRIYQFSSPHHKAMPRWARVYVYNAISLADRRLYDQACIELARVCELGYCEDYDIQKRKGNCQ